MPLGPACASENPNHVCPVNDLSIGLSQHVTAGTNASEYNLFMAAGPLNVMTCQRPLETGPPPAFRSYNVTYRPPTYICGLGVYYFPAVIFNTGTPEVTTTTTTHPTTTTTHPTTTTTHPTTTTTHPTTTTTHPTTTTTHPTTTTTHPTTTTTHPTTTTTHPTTTTTHPTTTTTHPTTTTTHPTTTTTHPTTTTTHPTTTTTHPTTTTTHPTTTTTHPTTTTTHPTTTTTHPTTTTTHPTTTTTHPTTTTTHPTTTTSPTTTSPTTTSPTTTSPPPTIPPTTTPSPIYPPLLPPFPHASVSYPNAAIVTFGADHYVFAGGRAFEASASELAAVRKVDPAKVVAAPGGTPAPTAVVPRPGVTVFTQPVNGNVTIYVIGADGELHPFATPTQFLQDGYDGANVITVPSLGGLTVGSSAGKTLTALVTRADGAIINSSGTFYTFAGGRAFGISTPAELQEIRKTNSAVELQGSVPTADTGAPMADGVVPSVAGPSTSATWVSCTSSRR